jgi:ATP-dependent Clp protease ATP-binding subunit ClpB
MADLTSRDIGFTCSKDRKESSAIDLDQKIYRTAAESARRNFSPEFMNRIDKVVVFRSLQAHHLREILDLELRAVQDRVMASAQTKFFFQCSNSAKELLLNEGIDLKYGARHLKRAIERLVVCPLSNLVATQQVGFGDLVSIDFDDEKRQLTFSRRVGGAFFPDSREPVSKREEILASPAGLGAPGFEGISKAGLTWI